MLRILKLNHNKTVSTNIYNQTNDVGQAIDQSS